HEAGAGGGVAVEVELVERRRSSLDQRHATTGDDALVDGGLRVANGVLDAVLALLELHLGRGTGLDDGHAARELRQTLLQLLTVVVAVGGVDLAADLGHATLDLRLLASTLDDRRLVLRDDDLAGTAEEVELRVLELEAHL